MSVKFGKSKDADKTFIRMKNKSHKMILRFEGHQMPSINKKKREKKNENRDVFE